MFTWWDMTDCHFSGYHITGIRILITGGHPFGAGIARAQTTCINITDLITGAEQPVVRTGIIIRRVVADIVELVTGIHGTVDSVITVGWRTWLAGAISGITGLRTVAEESIIAGRVIRAPYRRAFSVSRITLLTIWTIHRSEDAIGDLIAAVGCAKFLVIAERIIWRVCTGIVDLVTFIHGTVDSVFAGRHTWLAVAGFTGLRTVAEQLIIALLIFCALRLLVTGIRILITGSS